MSDKELLDASHRGQVTSLLRSASGTLSYLVERMEKYGMEGRVPVVESTIKTLLHLENEILKDWSR
jgi:hypothetical protein